MDRTDEPIVDGYGTQIPEFDYATWDLPTKLSWLTAGPGAGGTYEASGALSNLGDSFAQVDANLRKAAASIGVEWNGSAAEAAGGALSRAGRRGTDLGAAHAGGAATVTEYGTSFDGMSATLGTMKPPEYGFWAQAEDLFSFAGLQSDYKQWKDQEARLDAEANVALHNHEIATRNALARVPTLDAAQPTTTGSRPDAGDQPGGSRASVTGTGSSVSGVPGVPGAPPVPTMPGDAGDGSAGAGGSTATIPTLPDGGDPGRSASGPPTPAGTTPSVPTPSVPTPPAAGLTTASGHTPPSTAPPQQLPDTARPPWAAPTPSTTGPTPFGPTPFGPPPSSPTLSGPTSSGRAPLSPTPFGPTPRSPNAADAPSPVGGRRVSTGPEFASQLPRATPAPTGRGLLADPAAAPAGRAGAHGVGGPPMMGGAGGRGSGDSTRRARYVIPSSAAFQPPLPPHVVGVLGPEDENADDHPW